MWRDSISKRVEETQRRKQNREAGVDKRRSNMGVKLDDEEDEEAAGAMDEEVSDPRLMEDKNAPLTSRSIVG